MNRSLLQHFERIGLLDEAECADVCRRLEANRSAWISHHDEVPIHSFGVSGFLVHSADEYHRITARTNPLLRATFADLYDRVRRVLEDRLDRSIHDHPTGGLPGFNLFGSHRHFATPFASAHFDVQHRNLDWPEAIDPNRLWSFTLPFALPRSGGSIDLWDLRAGDLEGLDDQEKAARVDARRPVHLEHRVGTLVLHRGNLLHRIAPTPSVGPDDRRYSLQGHIAESAGVSYWYW